MFTYPVNHTDIGIVYGIDPGSIRLGLSVFTLHFKTYQILDIHTETIEVDKLYVDPNLVDVRGYKTARLMELSNLLYDKMCVDQPVVLSIESPFYNRFRPNAYGTLVETTDYIKLAYNNYNNMLPLHSYPPLTVKKAVGVKKSKGKENVSKAIMAIGELTCHLPHNLTGMSEHEIDAVAVAYTYVQSLRDYGDPWSVPTYVK